VLVVGVSLLASAITKSGPKASFFPAQPSTPFPARHFRAGQVLTREWKDCCSWSHCSGTEARNHRPEGPASLSGHHRDGYIVGLTEIGAVERRKTAPKSENLRRTSNHGSQSIPIRRLIPVTRANGIAYFEPVPEGGLVSGQSGLVATEGWTSEQRAIKKPIGLHLFWPKMELEASMRERGGRRGGGKAKSVEEQAADRQGEITLNSGLFRRGKGLCQSQGRSGQKTRFQRQRKFPPGKRCCLMSEANCRSWFMRMKLAKSKRGGTGPTRTATK